jgi:hypothetical protein
MYAIANFWNMFFAEPATPAERRDSLIHSIRLHNLSSVLTVMTVDRGGGFLVFVANKKEWEKTFGDYPARATQVKLIDDTKISDFVNRTIITDETVLAYARDHITADGYPDAAFFDKFEDDERLLVYIHPSHFVNRIEKNADGTVVLVGSINKTRDPFVVFEPSCRILRVENGASERDREYEILTPEAVAVRVAYNKSASQIGRKTIE